MFNGVVKGWRFSEKSAETARSEEDPAGASAEVASCLALGAFRTLIIISASAEPASNNPSVGCRRFIRQQMMKWLNKR